MLGKEIRDYFNANAPPDSKVKIRTENALIRGGIETMEQLAEASDHDIRRVRNLGDQCFALAISMRGKYRGDLRIEHFALRRFTKAGGKET